MKTPVTYTNKNGITYTSTQAGTGWYISYQLGSGFEPVFLWKELPTFKESVGDLIEEREKNIV